MGPRCFESDLYHYGISNPYDRQCISSTEKGSRCRFTLRESELVEVNELTLEAEDMSDGEDRDEVLRRLVLLRICGNVHRAKLDANPKCVGEVARRYGHLISISAGGSRRNSPSPRTIFRAISPKEPDHWSDGRVLRPYYQLRPRDKQGKAITNMSQSGPVFVPYSLGNTVQEVMLNDVPYDYAREGQVYAYTWPEYPGFVKIGYTTNLSSRLSAWNACMPGLKLLDHVTVPFPARVEELVHLQMNDVRQMIQRCKSCDKLHLEWFKATADEATNILKGWRDVVERQPLYDSSRKLTELWKTRISGISTAVTAKQLLHVLDEEEEVARVQEAETARLRAEQLAQAVEEQSKKDQEAARINEKKLARAQKVELATFSWDQILDIFEDFVINLMPQEAKKTLPVVRNIPPSTFELLPSSTPIMVS